VAYHEQHERNCPHCDARISATAPKCLNCGEYVDDPDDEHKDHDDPEAKAPPRVMEVLVGVVIAILCVALLLYITW